MGISHVDFPTIIGTVVDDKGQAISGAFIDLLQEWRTGRGEAIAQMRV